MTPENFCYWLQGWLELNTTVDHRDGATPETLKMIKDHLDLVFKKVTPDRKEDNTNELGINLKEIIDQLEKDKLVPVPNGPLEPLEPFEPLKPYC